MTLMPNDTPMPERGFDGERAVFDLDALSDHQIALLGHALQCELNLRFDEGSSGTAASGEVDRLLDDFTRSVGRLAQRSPQRVRGLLRGWANGDDPDMRIVAAYCAVDVAYVDYELALTVLFAAARDESLDAAYLCASKIAEALPPQQAADFQQRWR